MERYSIDDTILVEMEDPFTTMEKGDRAFMILFNFLVICANQHTISGQSKEKNWVREKSLWYLINLKYTTHKK